MRAALQRVSRIVRRLGRSAAMVLGLTALAAVAVALAALGAPPVLVVVAVLVLVVGLGIVEPVRPSPVLSALALVGLLAVVLALALAEQLTVWLVLFTVVVLLAGLVDDPLGARLAPTVRAVQLPGVTATTRRRPPGPYAMVVWVAVVVLALLLLVRSVVPLPSTVDLVLLVLLVGALGWRTVRLRQAVQARRSRVADRAVRQALVDYAPQFYVYFSGPAAGDYQIAMWLPYLERLGVRYAVLSRDSGLLSRASALTSAPVIACRRLAGLDDCLVPSVRAIFYVNTHHQCVDGVRYLDRTHVHLNHGDSDKPSSYHPMIAMFDQVFVAGQAAVERFARHGVVVPAEKFVLVGRPQVAGISSDNLHPVPGRPTVLYAPTWRGGVSDMSFSSLRRGEVIVQALVDRGARVVFRPHPFSARDRASATAVARIDALLAAAATPDCPHLTSEGAPTMDIAEAFNTSDALVTDVSSVASDYLQSGKPMAVVDLRGTDLGDPADPQAQPVLRAAYLLDLAGDVAAGLEPMLSDDPLAATRDRLRSHYLGDHADAGEAFVTAAARALEGSPVRADGTGLGVTDDPESGR